MCGSKKFNAGNWFVTLSTIVFNSVFNHLSLVVRSYWKTPLMTSNSWKKIAVTFTNFLPSYSTLPSRTTPWFLKNKLWWNYPEPHSLHQEIMSYHPGIPPYWSIKIPYSPSVPFSGRTLLGKSLSNLHHHVLITCLGHYQWHPFSYCTPCLQINPTFHCRRW